MEENWKTRNANENCLFFPSRSFETQSSEVGFLTLNPSFSGDLEWEIPRANLNVEKVIGRGAFGVVSRGLALDLPGKPGWTVVAVKSIQGQFLHNVLFIFFNLSIYNNTTYKTIEYPT